MGRLPRFERLSDCPPPLAAAAALARRRHAFFLDSAMSIGAMGRYSFAGCDPSAVFTAQGRSLTLRTRSGARRWLGDPIDALDEILAQRRIDTADYPVPFTGGAVGFLSYDLGRAIERLPELAAPGLGEPDVWLGFYDEIIAYDLHDGEAYLILNGEGDRRRAEDGPPSPLHAQRRAAKRTASRSATSRPSPTPRPSRRSSS